MNLYAGACSKPPPLPVAACRPRLRFRCDTAINGAITPVDELPAELWRTMLDVRAPSPVPYDRPCYHVMPRTGWINDPNGPIYYRGLYHMFFQHLPHGCEWSFGLVWGHAVSEDLVQWELLPPALVPSPNGHDADGCFSGCTTVDRNGVPTILYTGVFLRSNRDCVLPPAENDLRLAFVESQLAAVPTDPDDPYLLSWTKTEKPWLPLPPTNLPLAGWRDPFVVEKPNPENGNEWLLLIGSGMKEQGGSVLVYKSPELHSGWRYEGTLCSGDGTTGIVWECPLLGPLKPLPPVNCDIPSFTLGLKGMRTATTFPLLQSQDQQELYHAASNKELEAQLISASDEEATWFFSISPDACTNPTIYWLGSYKHGIFDLPNARGPFRLDLGDTLYAPNMTNDKQGRTVLWGWLQEKRTVGSYDYAGCLTVPRCLYVKDGKLFQEPLPELTRLRSSCCWHTTDLPLLPGQPIPLPSVGGPFLDIEICLKQGSAVSTAVVLKSWNAEGEGSAAILYDWEKAVLEVVFEAIDPASLDYSLFAPGARRVGGQLEVKPGQLLQLRILMDYSCLEIYSGSGEVLSTRIYRGVPPAGSDAGIELVTFGGEALVTRLAAYEMGSIWKGAPREPVAREENLEMFMEELEELGV